MATNTTKIALGAVLLLVSTVMILGLGTKLVPVPPVAGGVAALLLAAGSLLIGTSEDGQPV